MKPKSKLKIRTPIKTKPPTKFVKPPVLPLHLVERCGNCHFGRDLDDDDLSVICRRYPPVPFKFSEAGGITTVYPVPRRDHWCGEWSGRNVNTTKN